MTPRQRKVVFVWLLMVASVVFMICIWDWKYAQSAFAGLAVLALFVEPALGMREIYASAPTLKELFSDSVAWKRYFYCYGFVLAVMAMAMLTVAQPLVREYLANPAPVLGLIIVPLLIPMVVYLVAVYKAAGAQDED